MQDYKRKLSKECTAYFSPDKLTLAANFTAQHRSFNINVQTPKKMRKDLFGHSKRSESGAAEQSIDNFDSTQAIPSDNPVYEDPRDVLGMELCIRLQVDIWIGRQRAL